LEYSSPSLGSFFSSLGYGSASTTIHLPPLASAFFYLQLSDALEHSSESFRTFASLSVSRKIIGLLYLRPFAPECVFGSANAPLSTLVFWMLLPLVVCGVFAAIAGVLVWRGAPSARDVWRHAASRCASALLIVYLPAARVALAPFNRETQGSVSYLASAPFVAWDSAQHRAMVGVAATLLAYFVVPFPPMLIYLVRRHMKDEGEAVAAAGRVQSGLFDPWFLLASVRDVKALWMWEPLVVNARRLVIAALVSLLPSGSSWLAFCILGTLILFIAGTITLSPYKNSSDNTLETVLLVCAAFLFAGSVSLASVPSETLSWLLIVCTAVLKGATMLLLLRLLLRRGHSALSELRRDSHLGERLKPAAGLTDTGGTLYVPLVDNGGPTTELERMDDDARL
jgi:hypothetical protein